MVSESVIVSFDVDCTIAPDPTVTSLNQTPCVVLVMVAMSTPVDAANVSLEGSLGGSRPVMVSLHDISTVKTSSGKALRIRREIYLIRMIVRRTPGGTAAPPDVFTRMNASLFWATPNRMNDAPPPMMPTAVDIPFC